MPRNVYFRAIRGVFLPFALAYTHSFIMKSSNTAERAVEKKLNRVSAFGGRSGKKENESRRSSDRLETSSRRCDSFVALVVNESIHGPH